MSVSCRLRSAARGDLIVPLTRTVRYVPRSFAVAEPSTWNALPEPSTVVNPPRFVFGKYGRLNTLAD